MQDPCISKHFAELPIPEGTELMSVPLLGTASRASPHVRPKFSFGCQEAETSPSANRTFEPFRPEQIDSGK